MRKQIVFPGIRNSIAWLKSMVGKLKGDIGLVQDTNSATQNISSGTYVIWKGDLYKANTAISSGASLSSGSGGNLTAVSGGIGNELNSNFTAEMNRRIVLPNTYALEANRNSDERLIFELHPSDGSNIGSLRLDLNGNVANFQKRTQNGWVTIKTW